MSEPLAIYLEDHRGGARIAIELLRSLQARYSDLPLTRFADSILIEIEEDEKTLKDLAAKIGGESNVLKETAAWISEKATRLKLSTASDDFRIFEELEILSLGIQGKLSLWNALQVISPSDARLRGFDFQSLISRAKSQFARVEARRLILASTALNAASHR